MVRLPMFSEALGIFDSLEIREVIIPYTVFKTNRCMQWVSVTAAEVPCRTAPFVSFSGRAEKEGPARPERGPIYEIVLVGFR